jgi:hypothetical protein
MCAMINETIHAGGIAGFLLPRRTRGRKKRRKSRD